MAQNLPRGTPGRVMVILALLTGGVVVSAWRDALQRQTTEWVRHPTALGDPGLLQAAHLPATLNTGGRTVSLEAGKATFHRRDDKMFRVLTGLEAPLPFTLFTTSENLAAHEDPKLYARTAPHQYVRLRASLAGGTPQPPAPVPSRPAVEPPTRPDENEPFASVSPAETPPAPEAAPLIVPVRPSPHVKAAVPPAPVAVALEKPAAPTPPGPAPASKLPVAKKPASPPPQVPPGEDPDKALALPAPKPSVSGPPPPIPEPPSEKPPVIRRAELVPDDEPSAPPVPPKAVPLPPEEQDSPVGDPKKGTL